MKWQTEIAEYAREHTKVECSKYFNVNYSTISKYVDRHKIQCLPRNCSGALNSNFKHGLKKHKLYSVWNSLKLRCYNKNHYAYSSYGARGIKVCEEWKRDFKCFYDWAIKNGYKEGLSIDRINNDGDYEPSNCRFVDMFVQSNNRRSNHLISFEGKTQSLSKWAKEKGINYFTLRDRITKLNWSIEEAFKGKPGLHIECSDCACSFEEEEHENTDEN